MDNKARAQLPEEILVKIMNYAKTRSLGSFASEVASALTYKLLVVVGDEIGLDFRKQRWHMVDYEQFGHLELSSILNAMRYISEDFEGMSEIVLMIRDIRDRKMEEFNQEQIEDEERSGQNLRDETVRISGFTWEELFFVENKSSLQEETLVELKVLFESHGDVGAASEMNDVIILMKLEEIGEDANIDFKQAKLTQLNLETLDVVTLAKLEDFVTTYFSDHPEEMKLVRERKASEALELKARKEEEKRIQQENNLAEAEAARVEQEAFEKEEERLALEEEKRLVQAAIDEKKRLADEERERLISEQRMEIEALERENASRARAEEERVRDERERAEAARAEAARLERERLEREIGEMKRVDNERMERERMERVDMDRAEKERLKREMDEMKRVETERLEREIEEMKRVERERVEREEASRLDQERRDAEAAALVEKQNAEAALALEKLQQAERDLLEAEAEISITSLEEIKNAAEETQLDILNDIQQAPRSVVAPSGVREKKTGRVTVTTRKESNGSSFSLNVPSDLSPGEKDDILIVVSKEGGASIQKYHAIYKKIQRDNSLANITLDDKSVIASAGREFSRINRDYVEQRGAKISDRNSSLSRGL